jgi:hypothetical protein
MRTLKRPRRYVAHRWLALARPLLRYSKPRDAYVLRLVGRKWGPVLKVDRRHRGGFAGVERRAGRTRVA